MKESFIPINKWPSLLHKVQTKGGCLREVKLLKSKFFKSTFSSSFVFRSETFEEGIKFLFLSILSLTISILNIISLIIKLIDENSFIHTIFM